MNIVVEYYWKKINYKPSLHMLFLISFIQFNSRYNMPLTQESYSANIYCWAFVLRLHNMRLIRPTFRFLYSASLYLSHRQHAIYPRTPQGFTPHPKKKFDINPSTGVNRSDRQIILFYYFFDLIRTRSD
jgi:hypothetical protein